MLHSWPPLDVEIHPWDHSPPERAAAESRQVLALRNHLQDAVTEPTQCCFGAATDDRCPQPAYWRSKQSPGLGWCIEHAKDIGFPNLERIHRPWQESMELHMNADPDITPEKREGLLRMFGILAEKAMKEP